MKLEIKTPHKANLEQMPEIAELLLEQLEENKNTISRRDILKLTWTVPVVLAMAPPLEVLPGSGGTPPGDSEGLTPGLWKQINNENNDNKQGNDPSQNNWNQVTQNSDYTPASNYASTFGVTPSFDNNITLSEAVALKGGGEKALARHAAAGLLNASNPEINYPYTAEAIISMVQTAYQTGDFETPKNLLDAANNLGTNDEEGTSNTNNNKKKN
jgi:hypothetical protein